MVLSWVRNYARCMTQERDIGDGGGGDRYCNKGDFIKGGDFKRGGPDPLHTVQK